MDDKMTLAILDCNITNGGSMLHRDKMIAYLAESTTFLSISL